jgi:Zn-dependent metalloprotease
MVNPTPHKTKRLPECFIMSIKLKLNPIFAIATVLTLLFSVLQPSAVSAQGGDGLKRQINPQSGRVSFIGPESGRVLSASRALGTFARPQDPARALVNRFATEFGLKNPARDLSEMKAIRSADGRVIVRYQQRYNGIPVIGGELIVNTNERGDLYSMNGEVSPNLSLQTTPTIPSTQAAETALQLMAKWYGRAPEDFVVSAPELWIYDESLLRPSTRLAELVWRMEVTAKDSAMPVRELILINAARGSISLHFNQIDTAWHLASHAATFAQPHHVHNKETAFLLGSPLVQTYTASNTSLLPGMLLCDQNQPNCTNGSNPEADSAHKYALGTYNFYAAQHHRDSMTITG